MLCGVCLLYLVHRFDENLAGEDTFGLIKALKDRTLFDVNAFMHEARLARMFPFLSYCAEYWGHHTRQLGELKHADLLSQYFSNLKKIAHVYVLRWGHWNSNFYRNSRDPGPVLEDLLPLIVCISWGLDTSFKALLLSMRESRKLENIARMDLDASNLTSSTLLTYAASMENSDIIRVLLDAGAGVNVEDGTGKTALDVAVASDSVAITRLLIKRGAVARTLHHNGAHYKPILAVALENKSSAMALLLIDELLDVNTKTSWKPLSDRGWMGQMFKTRENSETFLLSPLSYAAQLGRTNLMKALIDRGAEIHEYGLGHPSYLMALHVAAVRGQTRALEMLLEYNANVHAKDFYGSTALYYACVNAELPCAQLLRKHGAIVDTGSMWSFMEAAIMDKVNKVDVFCHREAFLNARDSEGRKLLMMAAAGGCPNVVEALIKQGVDVNAYDIEGRTALMHVVLGSRGESVRWVPPRCDITFFHGKEGLRNRGYKSVMPILLKGGGSVEQKDLLGKTVRDYAKTESHLSIDWDEFNNHANEQATTDEKPGSDGPLC